MQNDKTPPLPYLCVYSPQWLFVPPGAVFAASNPCSDEYTVQNHDTLISIADLCGTTVSNILALNPQVANSNLIYNGQVLRVRGKVIPSYRVTYTSTSPATYTILEGDTFLSIAASLVQPSGKSSRQTRI